MTDSCISIDLKNYLHHYDSILDKIRHELGIERAVSEIDAVYVMRIIYSAIGHVALASLFDLNDDNVPISVTHFKRRVQTLFSCYKEMFSKEMCGSLTWGTEVNEEITLDEFSNEIYNLFLKTGHAYHYDNHLLPAQRCQAHLKGITFLRGQAPGEQVKRSGLGAYKGYKNGSNDSADVSIQEMFHLPTETLVDFWNRIVSKADFSVQAPGNLQYLNTKYFSRGYWILNSEYSVGAHEQERVLLARTNGESPRLYYLCKYQDGYTYYSKIDSLYYEQHDGLYKDEIYRRLSNACLNANGLLPNIRYIVSETLVCFQIGYLLPPEELNLLLLYSWPCDLDKFRFRKENETVKFDHFNRCMVLDVFDALRPVYEKLGYCFKKVDKL